jgi:hypothetical protein
VTGLRRKDLPEELRDAMGEYRDPRINLMKSVVRLATTLENDKFQHEIFKLGTEEGWLASKENKKGNLIAEIASEGSWSMGPLRGMYTTPEIAKIFNEYNARQVSGDFTRLWYQMVGFVKLGKTVLDTASQARNVQSNVMMAVRNGWISPLHPKRSWNAFVKSLMAYNRVLTPEQEAYLVELTQAGVIGTSVSAGDLRDAASRISEELSADDFGAAPGVGLIPRLATGAYRTAAHYYKGTDEALKIFGFEIEADRYAQSLYGKPFADLQGQERTEVMQRASSVLRGLTPDYDMVPKVGRILRASPLFGTFISWPLEIFRTYGNWYGQVRQDYANPKTRHLAIGRALYASSYLGMLYGVAAGTASLLGITDDEEDALTPWMKPWQQDHQKVWLGRNDKTGEWDFINLGYVDPYAFWKRPLHMLLRDDNDTFAENFWQSLVAGTESIVQPDLLAATVTQGLMNHNMQTGKPIMIEEYGAFHPENLERMREFLRKRLQPGFVKRAWDMYDAGTIGRIDEYGNVKTPEGIAMETVGVNREKIRPQVAFEKFLIGQRVAKEAILEALKSTQFKEMRNLALAVEGGQLSSEQIALRREKAEARIAEMYELTEKTYNEHLHDLGFQVKQASEHLNIPQDFIRAELKQKRYSKDEIAVIFGNIPHLKPKLSKPK